MTAASGPADWLAWWSWPWRVAGAWPGAFPSLAPQELSQPILPGWLFANSISVTEENSRSPETERDIVAAHSYGQQLGRIIDVVDELIRERPAGAPDSGPVREFAGLRDDIEAIKARQAAKRAEQNSGSSWTTAEIESWPPVPGPVWRQSRRRRCSAKELCLRKLIEASKGALI
jgi:hypothetical protein